jgi:hypothetical protein
MIEVKFALEQTLKAQRVLVGDGWLTPRPGRLSPGEEMRYQFNTRLRGWGEAGPVWMGTENLAPYRDSIPGHPACSE